MTTTMPVCTIRLVLKTGSSKLPPGSSSGCPVGSSSSPTPDSSFSARVSSGTAAGTLSGTAAGDPLEPLDHRADRAHRGGEDRVGAPHRGDQPGAGEKVGDVVLAEVDEAEAESQRVSPAERPLLRAR